MNKKALESFWHQAAIKLSNGKLAVFDYSQLTEEQLEIMGLGASSITSVSEEEYNAISANEDGIYVDGSIISRLGVNDDGHLTFDGSEIQGGGGGGGYASTVKFSIRNLDGWTTKSVVEGSENEVNLTWSCLEDDVPTGDGTLVLKVNNATKRTMSVSQGEVTLPITDYLEVGTNKINITITDGYGHSRALMLTVKVVSLSISSTFDATYFYSGSILFSYTPMGSAEKTVHFIVDDVEIGTQQTSVTGRQQSYTIPAQPYGAHSLKVYFSTELDGMDVRSNTLIYELISTYGATSDSKPIITTDIAVDNIKQYESFPIGFMVYTPSSIMSDVTIQVNGITVSEQSVSREKHTYVYRPTTQGEMTITFISGETTKEVTLNVRDSGMDISPVTDQLKLYLSSYGRSNNESTRDVWEDTDNNISCNLTGFNWKNNGWIIDKDGITALRVSNGARVEIPYKIFGSDFRQNGKTIEFEFATRYITDVTDIIMTCMRGGIGIEVTPQKITMHTEQSELSSLFKEDEHVRVGFVVEKGVTVSRLIYVYINGIKSGTVQYSTNDNFEQGNPANLVIGADSCAVDIYNIRVYDTDLSAHEMVNNWIADTQNLADMLYRYNHNDIYDDYGNISLEKLPKDLPYLVMEAPSLPAYKGDKKKVSGYFVDPTGEHPNYKFVDAEYNVQGTSSQYYARKNFKAKYSNGFILDDETTVSKLPSTVGGIPVKTFCYKVDVASSEGANNAKLAMIYDDLVRNVYLTPAQKEDARVREGVGGFPFVLFYDDQSGIGPVFYGKANYLNDKSNEDVFGFKEGDESWEIKNNTDALALFKDDDFESTYVNEKGETVFRWLDTFEGRYPDGNEDPTNLKPLLTWLKSTDTEAATNTIIANLDVTDTFLSNRNGLGSAWGYTYANAGRGNITDNSNSSINLNQAIGNANPVFSYDNFDLTNTHDGNNISSLEFPYIVNGSQTYYPTAVAFPFSPTNNGTIVLSKIKVTVPSEIAGSRNILGMRFGYTSDFKATATYLSDYVEVPVEIGKEYTTIEIPLDINPTIAQNINDLGYGYYLLFINRNNNDCEISELQIFGDYFANLKYDSAEYRLEKFKNETNEHLELRPLLFYYLFTEMFLMVDSRAKNAFPTQFGDGKWLSYPYDFDTALGISVIKHRFN